MTVCPSITPGLRGIETGELLEPRSGFSENLCYKEVILSLEITTPLGVHKGHISDIYICIPYIYITIQINSKVTV